MASIAFIIQVCRPFGSASACTREPLERGEVAVGSLGDDGYGRMIKGGLDRLGERLAPA
jgi:hypothetical protein